MNFSRIPPNSALGRLARAPVRLIPDDAVVRVLQGRLRGKRWIAGSSLAGCWLGSYELEKVRLFERVVKPRDVVYDIGANVGYYSVLASVLVGPQGVVYAFEPSRRNTHFLRSHLRLNCVSNVRVIEAAASDKDGMAGFDDSSDRSQGKLSDKASFTVPTVAIDSMVEASASSLPTCLKVDVEGAEYQVLLGARNTLMRARPTIFLATHGPELNRDCRELLTGMGYTCRQLGPYEGEVIAWPDAQADMRSKLLPDRWLNGRRRKP